MKTIDRTPRKAAIVISLTALIFILLCASTHGYGRSSYPNTFYGVPGPSSPQASITFNK